MIKRDQITEESVLRRIEVAIQNDATYLNLSYCNLIKIPVEITQLGNLTSLDLSGNQINSITEIGQLTNLTLLDL